MGENPKVLLSKIENIIFTYINSLDSYSYEQLIWKPEKGKWSIGQMYNHLISATLNRYFKSIEKCISETESINESMLKKSDAGNEIYELGSYPPVKIKGRPDSIVQAPQNPKTKQSLYDGLQTILIQASHLAPRINDSDFNKKVVHPRLGALNAIEWFQLTEMHFRHHLRQKKELEQLLDVR
ncbi:DinB family protein [Bacillus sp. Marseille-Q3570]|uniref:DinB family protein n=1 Tax=Bacillus sp. Marseille-Q3570 TaxID=2963522 RepID=UPI0021B6E906|nr:DinB family protein [Bacillus sp. Marseille-Q3570]